MENSFLGLEAEELILGWWKADLGDKRCSWIIISISSSSILI